MIKMRKVSEECQSDLQLKYRKIIKLGWSKDNHKILQLALTLWVTIMNKTLETKNHKCV